MVYLRGKNYSAKLSNKMKETVAVILNTNQLGGAERSVIEQLAVLQDQKNFIFFIPDLSSQSDILKSFLAEKKFDQIRLYQYPGFLYHLSQKNLLKVFSLFFYAPAFIYYLYLWNKSFREFKTFYINGNKASFPVLAWATVFRKVVKVFWHFRDFPEPGFFRLISKCLSISRKYYSGLDLQLVANSYAVKKELQCYLKHDDPQVLYNLVGDMPVRPYSKPIRTLGVASMHAPWKGLHCVLLMALLYRDELKSLGIQKIKIYGSNIYQTTGSHGSYSHQLKEFMAKFPNDMIEWCDNCSPQRIFSEIDLLIHPSIRPEPFGRVILEAYKSHVPVISTGLGGSSELLGDNEFGLRYLYNDYKDLFLSVQAVVTNEGRLKILVEKASLKAREIEIGAKSAASNLLK